MIHKFLRIEVILIQDKRLRLLILIKYIFFNILMHINIFINIHIYILVYV